MNDRWCAVEVVAMVVVGEIDFENKNEEEKSKKNIQLIKYNLLLIMGGHGSTEGDVCNVKRNYFQ